MTLTASSPHETKAESTLQREVRLSSKLFSRLVDALLNRMFDLRPQTAIRRLWCLFIIFLITGFLISLRLYPLNLWGGYVGDIFSYLFNLDHVTTPAHPGNPFANLMDFVNQVVTAPRIIQYFSILLVSSFIALQGSALYLSDIFELEYSSVARSFIWELALLGRDRAIHISHGDISEQDHQSPNYLIGGPGKVIVDLDSVGLFERPDGTPHIIGPTEKEPGGKATLEGYERFRQAIDIRDHYMDLQVKSRSRDGIPITATDVRLMFSIYRGGVKPTADLPYPFSKEAVEQIVYQATSRVTPELPSPSTYVFSWINKIIRLIRGELGTFMNNHELTAYLASIGMPEFERAKAQEAIIAAQARQITGPVEETPQALEVKPPPDFTPRREISNLFSQFARKFTDRAREHGVELHWIGVGTWKTPVEIVREKHLEAWKLSQENLYHESKEVLTELESEAIIQKMVMLIQDVPVAAYQSATEEEKEHTNAIRSLLLAYRQQLIEAADFMHEKGETVSPSIIQAIEIISKIMGFTDWH